MATQMTTSEIDELGGTYRRENGDTQVSISRHVPSGELYALRFVSVWHGLQDEGAICIGHTISDVIGPLHHSDVRDGSDALRTPADMANVIDALDGADALEDVDWAREQDWLDVISADEAAWAHPSAQEQA